MEKNKIEIYVAAALFNARETFFNSTLVEKLEEKGYKANFPQRDGFEFSVLTEKIAKKFPEEKINPVVKNIIYFFDMGILIPKSDVILANFDEPLDAGVLVETTYSNLIGKFIVGFRTDVRSPYGSLEDRFGGMHFFPAYQTNHFIIQNIPSKKRDEGEKQINLLVQKIDSAIKKSGVSHEENLPAYVKQNPNVNKILEGAKLLFDGISNCSNNRLEQILERYEKYEKILEKIGPKI
ncbi:MAG: nucleoside 2-deoxyribosyltransferase [Nanoarchaeota archaeon]